MKEIRTDHNPGTRQIRQKRGKIWFLICPPWCSLLHGPILIFSNKKWSRGSEPLWAQTKIVSESWSHLFTSIRFLIIYYIYVHLFFKWQGRNDITTKAGSENKLYCFIIGFHFTRHPDFLVYGAVIQQNTTINKNISGETRSTDKYTY